MNTENQTPSEIFYKLLQIDKLNEFQAETQKILILSKLELANYNMSKAALKLGITRAHLYRLTEKYNIPIRFKPDRTKIFRNAQTK